MSNAKAPLMDAAEAVFRNPWPPLATGLGAAGLSLLCYQVFGLAAVPLSLGGALAAGIAVAIRPQSPVILGLAALSGLLAAGGLAWDSASLLLCVMSAVGVLAGLLLLLPQFLRRAVVSLLILVHFGGILSAVTSVPPTPWLSAMAWAYFYRPYLEFMYLNNAYHFYSPEPGPGALIWFYVKYEDGTAQWYKIPSRELNPLGLEYQRRLSFSESINQLVAPGPVSRQIVERRVLAGQVDGIPPLMDVPEGLQFRIPVPFARRMLETYARYVAGHVPHPTDPDKKVVGVRIYRVVHDILIPKLIQEGVHPESKWLYHPFYQGEYAPDGKLKDPEDPYLFWLIPIIKKPNPTFGPRIGGDREAEVVDYLEKHVLLPVRSSGVTTPTFLPGQPITLPTGSGNFQPQPSVPGTSQPTTGASATGIQGTSTTVTTPPGSLTPGNK